MMSNISIVTLRLKRDDENMRYADRIYYTNADRQRARRGLRLVRDCRLCNGLGRVYRLGEPAKFFGAHTRVALCKSCWSEVLPLIRPLREVYRNQRRLKEKLNGQT